MTRFSKIKKLLFLIIVLAALTISFNGPQGILAESPSCSKAFNRCLQKAKDLDDAGKTGEMALMVVFCTYGYVWCLTFIE